MAVALILAADVEENVVGGGEAVARRVRTHPSKDCAANRLCNHGWLLSRCFFKPLFIRGGFAERAHSSAAVSCFAFRRLHTFRLASCPVQWDFLCWALSLSRCYSSAAVVLVKLHQTHCYLPLMKNQLKTLEILNISTLLVPFNIIQPLNYYTTASALYSNYLHMTNVFNESFYFAPALSVSVHSEQLRIAALDECIKHKHG